MGRLLVPSESFSSAVQQTFWLLMIKRETDAEAGPAAAGGGAAVRVRRWNAAGVHFNHTHVRGPECIQYKRSFSLIGASARLIPPPARLIREAPSSPCSQAVAQEGAAGSMSSWLMKTEQAGTPRARGLPRCTVNSPHLHLLARPRQLLS